MNVALPPDLEKHVESLVNKGHYPESSAVIEEALRQHQVGQTALKVTMTHELERLLDEGMKDLDSVRTTEELRRTK
jgi:putative addiction module CopG family antidote